jgi:GTP-binding protein EngB required for normal cell division
MSFKLLQKQYLKKLENTKKVLEDVDKFSKFGIFEEEDLEKIQNIKLKCDRYFDKLDKGEIEVAIVGMENSGKSTFANALVKVKEAFPTGSSRATFTSTKVKYGPEDKAYVEFYTQSEFNEIFRGMLSKVKYPESENADFMTMSLKSYSDYFDKLRETDIEIYKANLSSTHKDIVDILEGKTKSEMVNYLGSGIRFFDRSQIESNELKSYITDRYIARTVKKVEIELKSFESTKEMVLYDVPGFNSATEKHKIETKKALNSADAIILIKNVAENPNLTGEELDILKSYDDSGIPFGSKTFVAGTKIDRLNKEDEVRHNVNILEEDVISHLGVSRQKIFIGSPHAYLQKEKIEEGTDSIERLKKLNAEKRIESVEELKGALKYFYENEVIDNLTKEINKTIQTLRDLIQNIISESSDMKNLESLKLEDRKEIAYIVENIKDRLEKRLSSLREEMQNDILEKKYFSKSLHDQIDSIITRDIDDKYIEDINRKKTDGMVVDSPLNTNLFIRKELYPEVKKNFRKKLVDLAGQKYKEYQDKLLDEILDILEVERNNIKYEEIRENLEHFLNKITQNIAYSPDSYNYLIDRFSTSIIEILIGTPRFTTDRKNKFLLHKNDVLALSFFYEEIKQFDSIFDLSLLRDLLSIDSDTPLEYIFKKHGIDDFLKYPIFGEILNLIFKKNIPLNIAIEIIKDVRSKVKRLDNECIERVVSSIESRIKKIDESDEDPMASMIDILMDKNNQVKNLEEVKDEIVQDIELVKKILKTAVIEAINLELPFVSSFNDQNLALIDNAWADFIAENYSMIKYEKMAELEEKKVILEEKKRVVSQLKELSIKLQGE